MIRRRRASKEPYEGYTLPAVSEKGGQFVDFNEVIARKPYKKVRIKTESHKYSTRQTQ
mgnify:CR=1 FL=1